MAEPAIAEIRATTAERPKLHAVRAMMRRSGAVRIQVGDEDLELPASLVKSLIAVTDSLDEGATVAIVSEEAEVSPSQAAKLLGVSRQYVDRLIEDGVLSSRRLPNSSYRKVSVHEVLAFKTTRERKRAAVRQIVDEAVAAGLDY